MTKRRIAKMHDLLETDQSRITELETINAKLLGALRYAVKILKPLVNDDLEPANIGAIQVMQRAIARGTQDERDWWCPTCKAHISGETVTFEEAHEVCGTPLEDANA